MNASQKRVRPRFGREVRFQLKPVSAAPFRAAQQSRFERLKDQLLKERFQDPGSMLEFVVVGHHYFDLAAVTGMLNLSLSLISVLHPEALMKSTHMIISSRCGKMKRYRKVFAQEYEGTVTFQSFMIGF